MWEKSNQFLEDNKDAFLQALAENPVPVLSAFFEHPAFKGLHSRIDGILPLDGPVGQVYYINYNMKKILINGNNYTSSYFLNFPERYDVVSKINTNSDFKVLSEKYSCIVNFYQVVEGDIFETFNENFLYVKELSEKCQSNDIQLVQISTADVYSKSHKWEQNVEQSDSLNLYNDYLISKRVCEKFLEKDHLILRTRNCFDDRFHPDNWLVKAYSSNKISNMIDVFTYIPDLEKVLLHLTGKNKKGIYNVVQQQSGSDLYFLNTLLKTKKFQHLTPDTKDHEDVLTFSNCEKLQCCDVNISKLLEEYTHLTDLNASVIVCWQSVREHLGE